VSFAKRRVTPVGLGSLAKKKGFLSVKERGRGIRKGSFHETKRGGNRKNDNVLRKWGGTIQPLKEEGFRQERGKEKLGQQTKRESGLKRSQKGHFLLFKGKGGSGRKESRRLRGRMRGREEISPDVDRGAVSILHQGERG